MWPVGLQKVKNYSAHAESFANWLHANWLRQNYQWYGPHGKRYLPNIYCSTSMPQSNNNWWIHEPRGRSDGERGVLTYPPEQHIISVPLMQNLTGWIT